MPNATITTYLNDEEFLKYLKNKETINQKARDLVKKEVAKLK